MGWDSYDVEPLVTGWVTGQHPNFGLLLKRPQESTNRTGQNFRYFSDDYAVAPNLRPKLEVTYSGSAASSGPTVALEFPSDRETLVWDEPVTLRAEAFDDGRVESVEFYFQEDGHPDQLVGTATEAPYEVPFDINDMTLVLNQGLEPDISLWAVATDDAGNATSSTPVTPGIGHRPTVSISALDPATSPITTQTVTVSASAASDSGVARVEFLVDGTLFATDTTAPYQATWDTLDPAVPGYDARPEHGISAHAITARAIGVNGLTRTSTPAAMEVDNTSGTKYQAAIAVSPPSVFRHAAQELIDVTVTNDSTVAWPRRPRSSSPNG